MFGVSPSFPDGIPRRAFRVVVRMRGRLLLFLLCALLLPWPQTAAGQASEEESYAFCTRLESDGLLQVAADQWERFADRFPESPRTPEALRRAARCHREAGAPEGAERVLVRFLESFPGHSDACAVRFELARLRRGQGRFREAADDYAALVREHPDCGLKDQAVLGGAECLMAGGEFAAAEEACRSLVLSTEEVPILARAYYVLGLSRLSRGRSAQALEAFETLVRLHPEHPTAVLARIKAGEIHEERGEPDQAAEAYRGAIEAAAEASVRGRALLALARLETGRGLYEEAAKLFLELARDYPDMEDRAAILLEGAGALKRAGSGEEALEFLERFAREFPDHPARARANLARARIHLERDERRACREALDDVGNEGPEGVEALRLRAELARREGRPEAAVDHWRSYLARAGGDTAGAGEVLFEIARTLAADLADTAGALDVYGRIAGEFAGRDEEVTATRKTAQLLEASGRWHEAARTHERLAEIGPNPGASRRKAEAIRRHRIRDTAGALEGIATWARRAAREPPGTGELIELAGIYEERLKDYETSLSLLEAALEREGGVESDRAGILLRMGRCRLRAAERARLDGDPEGARRREERARRELEAVRASGTPPAAGADWLLLELGPLAGDTPPPVEARRLLRRHLVAFPRSPHRAEARLHLGRSLAASSRADSVRLAVTELGRALREAPEDPGLEADILVARAHAQVRLGAREEAEADLAHAAERLRGDDPRLSDVLYQRASNLSATGRHPEAIELYERVSRDWPRRAVAERATVRLGDSFFYLKDYGRSAEVFRGYLERYPQALFREDALYRLALAMRRNGGREEAVRTWEAFLEEFPGARKATEARVHLGRCALEAGDAARAFDHLERALESGGALPEGFDEDYCRAALESGRPGKGADLARRRLEEGPDPGTAGTLRFLRARCLFAGGEIEQGRSERKRFEETAPERVGEKARLLLDEALAVADGETRGTLLDECAQRYPQTPAGAEARFHRGLRMLEERRPEEAVAEMRAFLAAAPGHERRAQALYHLGRALFALGRFDEAEEAFASGAKETGADSVTVFRTKQARGLCLQELEEWERARRVWEEMLAEHDEDDVIGGLILRIGRCLQEEGRPAEAVAAYRRAVPFVDEEGRARATYWAGICFESMGRLEEAVAEYLKVPYLYSGEGLWSVTASLKAARAYEALGREEEARALYGKVLEQHGKESQWGRVARDGLARLERNHE
jgi:TolA-binding protein